MKILFFGYKGWIGSKFLKLLEENNEIIKSVNRVENKEAVEEEIKLHNPSHILCCIGRTSGTFNDKTFTTIDYLEQKGKIKENVRDNLFSPIVLAILSQKYNCHLTYIGTGCIFAGYEGFTEEDLPNFFGSSYSTVKGYTDELMHLFGNVLNLRIRMPITDDVHNKNFITKITKYEYICSIPNSMSVLNELIPYAIDMMKKNITGTINLTNSGLISHNEILQMYKGIIDPNFVWKNFTVEQQNAVLDAERSNNLLNTNKLESMYPVKHIKDAVYDMLIKMKNNI